MERKDKVKELLKKSKQDKIRSNKTISSGSAFIDLNINPAQPGLKCGKVHVVAGRPGSGKTSFGLGCIRQFLDENIKLGIDRTAILIDVENGCDDSQLHLYGLTKYNTPNFEYKNIEYGPEILNLIDGIIKAMEGSEEELLIFVDSVPHLSWNKDDAEMDYAKAEVVAQGPNKLRMFFKENKSALAKTNVCLIFATFLTYNIGRKYDWEPKFVPTGGSYLEYAADTFIDLEIKGAPRETEHKPPSGSDDYKKKGLGKFQDVALNFRKNKFAAKREILYTLCLVKEPGYKTGIQDLRLMVNYAVEKGVVNKRGSWYDFMGASFQGQKALLEQVRLSAQNLKANVITGDDKLDKMFETLYNEVRSKLLEEHRLAKE